jgi:hypothetical protein
MHFIWRHLWCKIATNILELEKWLKRAGCEDLLHSTICAPKCIQLMNFQSFSMISRVNPLVKKLSSCLSLGQYHS